MAPAYVLDFDAGNYRIAAYEAVIEQVAQDAGSRSGRRRRNMCALCPAIVRADIRGRSK
jgi:hypothetical protein